jgi:ribosomal protein L37AE/L43A
MILRRCPKCRSRRVRRGYTDTPLLLRAIGIYSLLCENCNLLFKGFALPGTVPARGSRRRKMREREAAARGRAPRP